MLFSLPITFWVDRTPRCPATKPLFLICSFFQEVTAPLFWLLGPKLCGVLLALIDLCLQGMFQIWPVLTTCLAISLDKTSTISHLDYCSGLLLSLLPFSPHPKVEVQHTARAIFLTPKSGHTIPVLTFHILTSYSYSSFTSSNFFQSKENNLVPSSSDFSRFPTITVFLPYRCPSYSYNMAHMLSPKQLWTCSTLCLEYSLKPLLILFHSLQISS